MTYSRRRRTRKKRSFLWISVILLLIVVIGGFSVLLLKDRFIANEDNSPVVNDENDTNEDEITDENDANSDSKEEEEEIKEDLFVDVSLAAVGDIMFHSTQLTSAHDPASGTYNFKPMFEDVKPILSKADLTLGNFETTMAGTARQYAGYPLFNTPDSVADALKDAGFDVLSTANNHSLDTGLDGLKRTIQVLREKGIDKVGTYDEQDTSKVLVKTVNDVTFGILSYTESTNGLGGQYPQDQLNALLNLMTKENIARDVEEAKRLNVDVIIAFMHWGSEYMREPNETQIEYAQFLAEQGVDIILGSHPHVIQKSDVIETANKETFVMYSMGNFISNQRRETLGNGYERTEDGIIVHIDIRKNVTTGETKIENVAYTPTWVLRERNSRGTQSYRILPIENFLLDDAISDSYKARMEQSYEATMSQMLENPFEPF